MVCRAVTAHIYFTTDPHRDAWKALGSISKEEAMMHYILLVNKLDPDWKNEDALQSSEPEPITVRYDSVV